ncbi:unnamed protein product [Fraxinus pennsylvanica]|uniref:Uncharacterized protein n=1 Tax=Fraxinus pennsylvanica TaxID=56036 RepID=A0AAD1YWV5_9LAMI|nr:unnamed protein product [Fraxinus pennsylvanica]
MTPWKSAQIRLLWTRFRKRDSRSFPTIEKALVHALQCAVYEPIPGDAARHNQLHLAILDPVSIILMQYDWTGAIHVWLKLMILILHFLGNTVFLPQFTVGAESQVQREGKAPQAKKGKLQRLHDVQDRPSKKSNLERQHGTQINLRSTVKSSSAHEQAGSKHNQKKVDNKSSSDLEVTEIANLGMEGNSSSILPSNQLDKRHPSGYSEFRKQIINILREPYKKEEYDELRQAIEAQKAEGSKEPSDLHEKLKKFEKERKKNLMERGFFFWLENKKMEGAFKPWKDPECAAVEQENCLLPPSPPPERRGRKKCATPFKPGSNPENLSSPSPGKKK